MRNVFVEEPHENTRGAGDGAEPFKAHWEYASGCAKDARQL